MSTDKPLPDGQWSTAPTATPLADMHLLQAYDEEMRQSYRDMIGNFTEGLNAAEVARLLDPPGYRLAIPRAVLTLDEPQASIADFARNPLWWKRRRRSHHVRIAVNSRHHKALRQGHVAKAAHYRRQREARM